MFGSVNLGSSSTMEKWKLCHDKSISSKIWNILVNHGIFDVLWRIRENFSSLLANKILSLRSEQERHKFDKTGALAQFILLSIKFITSLFHWTLIGHQSLPTDATWQMLLLILTSSSHGLSLQTYSGSILKDEVFMLEFHTTK